MAIISELGEIPFEKILSEGFTMTTSGTTGPQKEIYRSPQNLQNTIRDSIRAQELSKDSKILQIARTDHAALLVQSLAGYTLGAEVTLKKFNAFNFFEDFRDKTHVFLAPAHMRALMQTKEFEKADFSGQRILCGSEPLPWQLIEAFAKKGAIVQPDWGMCEIGPVVIYSVYRDVDSVRKDMAKYPNKFLLGDTFLCDYKIVDNVLWVKGDTCISDDWFCTDDIVEEIDSKLFFKGRVHKEGTKPFRLDYSKWKIE